MPKATSRGSIFQFKVIFMHTAVSKNCSNQMFVQAILREWGIPLWWEFRIPLCSTLGVSKELTENSTFQGIFFQSSVFICVAKLWNHQPGHKTVNKSQLWIICNLARSWHITFWAILKGIHSHEAWIKANNLDNIWAEKAPKWRSAMVHKEVFAVKGICFQLFFSSATFWKLCWGRKNSGTEEKILHAKHYEMTA